MPNITTKKIIGKVHLWLGLTSGIIVFVIAITGCLYAFQAEISDKLEAKYRYVTPLAGDIIQPTTARLIAEKAIPGKHIHSVQYGKRNQSICVVSYNGEPAYYYMVYINPYNGEVLKVKDMDKDFFRVVLQGHYYLWLPPAIGQPIVITATVVFVVMMITGLILWWPKNKAAAKQRFSVKWSAAWRRKNYDLHNVLGFYMTWVVIFMAITGLVFGWQWFARTLYKATGGRKTLTYEEPVSDTTKRTSTSDLTIVDKLWWQMQKEHADAAIVEMHFPGSAAGAIEVAVSPDADVYWNSSYIFYDQYTMKELPVKHLYGRAENNKAFADKLLRMNYDIHVGAIWGFPGKLLAFFASLIAGSLPITGFIIWWGRRKKKKPTAKAKDSVAPAVSYT